MSEGSDFSSILNVRLSQIKTMFDNNHNKLINYCNNIRNNILRANMPPQNRNYYINGIRQYFNEQYNIIKNNYNLAKQRAQKEYEEMITMFFTQENVPEVEETVPEVVEETVPEVVETVPEVVETVPEVVETVPEVVETVPEVEETVPEVEEEKPSVTFKINKKALIVGCNYTGTSHKLHGCINDVHNIKDRLTSKYKFEDITLMTDKTDVKPTKKILLKVFNHS